MCLHRGPNSKTISLQEWRTTVYHEGEKSLLTVKLNKKTYKTAHCSQRGKQPRQIAEKGK